MMKIRGKVFVVTGARGGIGGQIISALLLRGAKVAAVDLKEDTLQSLKKKLGDKSQDVSIHALNISDSDNVSHLPQAVIKAHGHIQDFFIELIDFFALNRSINLRLAVSYSISTLSTPVPGRIMHSA